ncbi:MAG: hypothetical protein JSS66_02175 [Armatimonadetes bacterium]|nr:hypothetical protein [Armatimonadota bacterium]
MAASREVVMSLVVTTSKVKERAGIGGSTYDTKISNLITDWVAMLEYAIAPSFLNDTGNTGLQATLNLGAVEMVAGEFLAQLAREPGGSESLVFGWLSVRPAYTNLADPFGIKAQGLARLMPFLKHPDVLQGSVGVLTGGSREPEE